MKEEIIFKRRNRLKREVVITSKVLLYGYDNVSDAAKITYQVIDGFDWEDKTSGDSKGFAFPATETLATIRRTSVRTIERHLKELEAAGLLTRYRRRYQPSILYIEDISQAEIDRYLAEYVDSPQQNQGIGGKKPPKASLPAESVLPQPSRNDKNVGSGEGLETTKMSVVYMKEKEGKEKESNVNAGVQQKGSKRGGQPNSIGEILKRHRLPAPKPIEHSDDRLKRDVVAEELAQALDDPNSLGCYRMIAEKVPHPILYQTLASVKEAAEAGRIRKSRGALFVEIIKQYADSHEIDLGFQEGKARGAGKRPQRSDSQ